MNYYDHDGSILPLEKAYKLFEDPDYRRVESTHLRGGKIHVSTVLLMLDHSFAREGPPVIFETMIFGGAYDQTMRRYCTQQKAREGHWEAVRMAESEGWFTRLRQMVRVRR